MLPGSLAEGLAHIPSDHSNGLLACVVAMHSCRTKDSKACSISSFYLPYNRQPRMLQQKCAVEGKPYAQTRVEREGIWHPSNSFTEPSGKHIGTPVETGPFDWVPDQFTRKQ